ncbi:MAG: hypothetical protein DMG16_05325, partial [Acidobacteria bacterium]
CSQRHRDASSGVSSINKIQTFAQLVHDVQSVLRPKTQNAFDSSGTGGGFSTRPAKPARCCIP